MYDVKAMYRHILSRCDNFEYCVLVDYIYTHYIMCERKFFYITTHFCKKVCKKLSVMQCKLVEVESFMPSFYINTTFLSFFLFATLKF